MTSTRPTVLILGAGINGCALARELALSDVDIHLVDQADIAFGATAYSSRLIHGGLRYLEYGEFDLVRESLAERTRLLHLAPQFVRPLQLFIPTDNRFGGLLSSAARFLGWPKRWAEAPAGRRGALLVRMGLWFYDTYARDPSLPKRATHRAGAPDVVRVDASKFRWLLSYYDAQVRYPERFTVALATDAARIAAEQGAAFRLHTYARARLAGRRASIHSVSTGEMLDEFAPDVIVNATGAWVDLTLAELHVPSKPLMGGTKGSHFVTHHAVLRDALGGKAIYAEAPDGRPVFILPFGDGVLVGTTDEPYSGDPADALASGAEIDYLLATVNDIVPGVDIKAADIDLHYCGVRPLPRVDANRPAAITRRHWIQEHRDQTPPLYSIIGGKLTTCRSLAEESARTILKRLDQEPTTNSRERLLPGANNYPVNAIDIAARQAAIARRVGLTTQQVAAVWALCGTDCETALTGEDHDPASLVGTSLPAHYARHVIRHEWATTLDDLVERRLMLLFQPALCAACLRQLAELMVAEGKLRPPAVDAAIETTIARLATHFGKRVAPLAT